MQFMYTLHYTIAKIGPVGITNSFVIGLGGPNFQQQPLLFYNDESMCASMRRS